MKRSFTISCFVLAACSDEPRAPGPIAAHRDAQIEDAALDAGVLDAGELYYQPCVGFDPRAVHMMGEEADRYVTSNHDDFPVIAPETSSDTVCYNFETSDYPQIRPNDGRIIYIASWEVRPQAALHLVVPDGYDASTGQRTRVADEVVPTPACDSSTRGVGSFVLNPETGEAYYTCVDDDAGSRLQYYDQRGEPVVEGQLHAASASGAMFLVDGPQGLDVVTLHREERVEVDLPDDGLGQVVAVRTVADGFWLAMATSDGSLDDHRAITLVRVPYSGKARVVTRFADFTTEGFRFDSAALDANGNLYEIRTTNFDLHADVVVVREIDGSEPRVIWREDAQPDAGLSLYLGDRAYLVTGP